MDIMLDLETLSTRPDATIVTLLWNGGANRQKMLGKKHWAMMTGSI